MSSDVDVQPAPVNKNTVRTRGGVTGHNVRYVLAFGLAGLFWPSRLLASILVVFASNELCRTSAAMLLKKRRLACPRCD